MIVVVESDEFWFHERNFESMSNWWIKLLIGVKLTVSIWHNYYWINFVRLGVLGVRFGALEMLQWQKNAPYLLPKGDDRHLRDENPVSELCEADACQQDVG